MKKQSTTPAKLQLIKHTVARLNGFSATDTESNFTDSETTLSTASCRTILM